MDGDPVRTPKENFAKHIRSGYFFRGVRTSVWRSNLRLDKPRQDLYVFSMVLLWLALVGTLQVARLKNYQDTVLFELKWDRRYPWRFSRSGNTFTVRFEGTSYKGPLRVERDWPLLRRIDVKTSSWSTRFTFTLPHRNFRVRIHPVKGGIAIWIYRHGQSSRAPPASGGGHAIRRIVIDPGHGGKDPGAIGWGGVREKTITLQVARKVAFYLKKWAPDLEVRLTRTRDVFVPLAKRGEMANRWGADLFVSIHCNYARNRRVRGLETYFLSDAKTKWARAVANFENGALRYEVEDEEILQDVLKGILSDLAQNAFLIQSQDLALTLHETILKTTRQPDRRVRQAGFYVLSKAYMPAVLIEIGFISNPREARLLASSSFQDRIARGIARGILRYIRVYARKNGGT